MVKWEPLRMMQKYKISPDQLSSETLAKFPGSMMNIAGVEKAYSKRQALAKAADRIKQAPVKSNKAPDLPAYKNFIDDMKAYLSGLAKYFRLSKKEGPPKEVNPFEDDKIFEKLCACACDEGSESYTPGFVTVLEETYPIKAHVIGWLANYYTNTELGRFSGTPEEKKTLARKFMKAHGIYEHRYSRTIIVSTKPTKQELKRLLKIALNWKKYETLCEEYETAARFNLNQREAVAKSVEVQLPLPF